jgi:hypothetical protein
MARRPTDDALIERAAEIADGALTDGAVADLRQALARKGSILVARAARAVASLAATELLPDLLAAFDRLLDSPAKADEGCLAKVALVEAMDAMALADRAPFLRGIAAEQMEPVWGGAEDTAAPLRVQCAFALARLGGADAMLAIAGLLTDATSQARVGAVKAVAHRGGLEAELLLRMKAGLGDEELDVTAECLTGLMAVEPERSLEFVRERLRAPDEALAEAAALALGESREPNALAALCAHRDHTILSSDMEDVVLLAIALTRRDEAVDYLLRVVADDTPANAARAVGAMRIYAHDTTTSERLRDAVEARDAQDASAAFREHFG